MVQFRAAEREIQLKVVYYGPALGGKTTNLEALHELADPSGESQLTSLKTAEDRTLFFDFLPLELPEVQGYRVRLQLYTVPGQVQYNTTRRVVLAGADGLVFVADSSPDRLQENFTSWENMKANFLTNKMNLETTPIVVQCNKIDLPNAADPAAVLGAIRASDRPAVKACALTGEGVGETFRRVVEATLRSVAERFGQSLKGVDPPALAAEAARAFAPLEGRRRSTAPAPTPQVFESTVALAHPLSEEEQLVAALQSSTQLAEQYQETRRLTEMYRQRLEEMTALYELGRSLAGCGAPGKALPLIAEAFRGARPAWAVSVTEGADPLPAPFEALTRPLGPAPSPAGHLVATPPEGAEAAPEDARFADLLEGMATPRLEALALMAELAAANERLERRVVERTADLAAALERLRELDGLKRAFLNGVSHEMRTPLTNVRSYADLLLRYPDQKPQDRREYLEVIRDESVRLEALISELLSFQRVKEPFRGQPCDLGEVLDDTLEQVEPRAVGRHIQFQVQRPAGRQPFPMNREDATVLFRQLLDNGVKFSPEGVRVRVLLLVDPQKFAFSVRDFGPGFPKEKREQATAPISGVPMDPYSKKSGLGLGLFLVREVLGKYHGALSVEDMEPGASVVVEVPRPDTPSGA